MRWLGGEIADRGHAELHAGGKLVTGNARRQFAVAGMLREMTRVHALQKRARGAIRSGRNAGRGQMAHRILGTERRALKRCGKKARSPVVGTILRHAARIQDGNERRHLLILAPERVTHPRAEAREAIEHEAGGEEVLGGTVGVAFAGQRMNEGDVVGEFCEMRDQVGDHLAGLAARTEFILRPSEIARRALKRHRGSARQRLVVPLD